MLHILHAFLMHASMAMRHVIAPDRLLSDLMGLADRSRRRLY